MEEEELTRIPPCIVQLPLLLQEPLLQGLVLDVADPERGCWNFSRSLESLAVQCFSIVDVFSDGIRSVSYGFVCRTT